MLSIPENASELLK